MLGLMAVAIGLMMAARRLEPHWVSKDRQRFICRAREVDDRGVATGGWHEYRFGFTDEDRVEGRRKGLLGSGSTGVWRVAQRLDDAPTRHEVFLLESDTLDRPHLSIRLPQRSPLVAEMTRITDQSR